MDAFDQAVQESQARRAAPGAEAKKALAPTRAAAIETLKEFDRVAARLLPGLETAQEKFQQASAMGVKPFDLGLYLREIFGDGGIGPGLIEGTRNGVRDLVNRIDTLTDWELYQRIQDRLPGALPSLQASGARLEYLAAAIEAEVATLPERIRKLNGQSMVTIVEPPAAVQPTKVEMDFEP